MPYKESRVDDEPKNPEDDSPEAWREPQVGDGAVEAQDRREQGGENGLTHYVKSKRKLCKSSLGCLVGIQKKKPLVEATMLALKRPMSFTAG